MKSKRKHRHSLTTWQPTHPFLQVSLDVIGSLFVLEGFKYTLLTGDQFIKDYDVIGMPNQEAQTFARVLVEM